MGGASQVSVMPVAVVDSTVMLIGGAEGTTRMCVCVHGTCVYMVRVCTHIMYISYRYKGINNVALRACKKKNCVMCATAKCYHCTDVRMLS